MEVLSPVIGVIMAEPCRFLFGNVQATIKNFSKRKTNFDALKNDIMSSLMKLMDEVQQKLDLKDGQLGVFPRSQVEDWLRKVDELKTKMEEFLPTISTSDGNNLQDYCCPFPLQCKLSYKLARKIEEAKQLIKDGNEVFEKMGDVRYKMKPVEHISGPSIIGQKTASENLARVLDLLSNDNVTRIGVCGMGGVGKTTLVGNLNNELGKTPSARSFRVIIWVTVSKETNLRKIQKRIAERLILEVKVEPGEERLNLEVKVEPDERMASLIHDRLVKNGPFLLILDDVWEEIKLDRLGIPRQELCPSSKIIITSRSLDVCRMMETQADLQMKALNDEEAWKLFREHAGEVVMKQHIRPIAEMVSKECDGLPLAIVVVGASMRGKSVPELWNDTLRALKMSVPNGKGIQDKLFMILKQSYDSLENKQTKFCFLFCCLYPEDFNIEVDELVRYWFCDGLLDERLNYEQIKNQGIARVHKLRDCCLLEEGKSENTVKMHDVVRDVGIWIAESFEVECKSIVGSEICLSRLWDTNFSSYKRLSFMNNQIASLPDCLVQCEEVSTLLLQGNENLDTLPASFLEGFQTLKILDLSGSNITSLPSLLQLHQLRALVLSRCPRLTELPPLDGQSRLLLLNCCRSGLRKLPESLEKLSNLRQLDVSYNPNLETIPYSVISKLSNLESLELSHNGRIGVQGLFEALPFLKQLIVLHATLDSLPHQRSNNVNGFQRIKEFPIGITTGGGEMHFMKDKYIKIICVCLSQESIGWLLCKANYWMFKGCEGLTRMFINLVTANISFASLKRIKISWSDISFGGGVASSFDLLPNLEEIFLSCLSKLESVSDLSKLLGLRFSRLKHIGIYMCPQLKCVISLEENQTLEKLEMIDVTYCEMLKSLFDYPNPRAQHMNQNPTAPNLQLVSMESLPNLENLWGNDESWQNVRELKFLDCPRIRKLPLTAQNAESIEAIEGEEEWWNRLKWDSEDTKMLLQQRFRKEWRHPLHKDTII